MIFRRKQVFDFREIRRMLWRRRLIILLPLAATAAAALVGGLFMTPRYQAIATIAVEHPVPLTRTVAQAAGGDRDYLDESVRIAYKRIRSAQFLESVAVQLGLPSYPHLQRQAERLAAKNPRHDYNDLLMRICVGVLNKMLDIRAQGRDVFYVRAVSSSPQMAFDVATVVSQLYIQTHRKSKLRQSEEAYTFAREQAAIYEAKLEEKRRELREFEQQMALKPLSSSPVTEANLTRVAALIGAADADIEFQRGRHEALRVQVAEAGLEPFIDLGLIESSKLRALRETLFELERHLALTLVEYLEGEAPVISGKNQIAVKSQQVLSELESACMMAFPSLVPEFRQLLVDYEYTRISLEAAQRRRQEFIDFRDRYATDLANMPADEFRLSRLREDVESAGRLHQTWLEQANSTQIAKAVQSAKVGDQLALIDPAQVPIAPFAPDKEKILMLAVVMGLALGIGTAIVMEYLDLTMKSVDEIAMVLELPILGAVPKMQAVLLEEIDVRRRRRVRILIPAVVATVLGLAAAGYYFFLYLPSGVG